MNWRPATAEDIAAFYGAPPAVPVRMIALDDGAGVCGLVWLPYGVFAVSWLTPQAKANKRAIVRGMRALQSLIEESGETVYARNDLDEPTADGFLRHCGFERLTDERDALYVYRGATAVSADEAAVRGGACASDPA